jgi:DNA-binding NtrC family response regulator
MDRWRTETPDVQFLDIRVGGRMTRSILLIDDDAQLLAALTHFFERRGWSVSRALDGRTGIELYERDAPDVVLTDLEMPGLSGLQVVDVLRSRDPEAVVVLLTGHGDIATAVEALKLGAEHFLTKPVDYDHLAIVAERAREKSLLRVRVATLADADPSATGADLAALGSSPLMSRLGERLRLLASGTAPVLLAGETGTGKGWLARRLHALSPRARAPFVAVNCAELTPSFLSSELFGHERGAFTDAKQARRGLFELADGGTLFLDEIGDLALEVQPKLLTVLDTHRFRRLGGTRELEVDVRVIAATNVDLRAAVRARRFREDLYYRLAVLPLELPPLRERGAADIAQLARSALDELRRRDGRGATHLAPESIAALGRYAWPGNIRELRNVLERALLLAPNAAVIEPMHLPPEIEGAGDTMRDAPRAGGELSLAAIERAHILRVLALADFNKVRAARDLGITRATLYTKLRTYGVGDAAAPTRARDGEPLENR